MKEKVFSLSGDDFTVKTVEGREVCKCKGKVMSVRDKKSKHILPSLHTSAPQTQPSSSTNHAPEFTDMNGNEIYTLSNKLLTIHKSFHAEAPGNADFEVKGHFSIGKSKSSVHFTNAADGQQVELEVKGDWFDRSATITYGGREVALIQRSFLNYRQIFGDKQTYYVIVAPNVDLSMIAGLCVCLDEKENEK